MNTTLTTIMPTEQISHSITSSISTGDTDTDVAFCNSSIVPNTTQLTDRFSELEQKIKQLQEQVASLQATQNRFFI